jgi:hypothetical protein
MKMYKKEWIQILISSLFFLSALIACTSEEFVVGDDNNNKNKSENTQVNISLTVPSPTQTQTQTRAVSTKSEPDESAVTTVHVLLFEKINGIKVYRFITKADNITATSPTQKTFRVTLPTGQYDIVVLANAQHILNTSGIAFGDTKENVLGAMNETSVGPWNHTTIAMWGQLNDQTINSQSSFSGGNAIRMIRMMAKIEVEVTPDAAGSNNTNFALSSIRLYNYSSCGALVPDLNTWPADNKAIEPTKPATPDGFATVSYPPGDPLVFSERTFYTYEAPAGGSGQKMSTNTFLIIGGSYRGGAVSYYRADFVAKNDVNNFLPLLRNYRYLVRIVDVVSNGYPTPEMACETVTSGMKVNILSWNDSGMENIYIDGTHTLEVSTDEFIFSSGAQTSATSINKLTIRTSISSGWSIEKITGANGVDGTASWLTVSEKSFSSPDILKDIYLYVTENTSGMARTGYIYIRAGKLLYCVTVTQQATAAVHMIITDAETNQEISELNFPHTGGKTKRFKVEWSPSSVNATVNITTVGGDAFSGTGLPANNSTLTGGSQTFDITAADYTGDAFTERISRIEFSVSDGAAIMSRSIFLRQVNFTLNAITSEYILDGGIKTAHIRSNIAWEVIAVSDPDNIITNVSEVIGKTGGPNTTQAGEAFTFRLANKMNTLSMNQYTATFVLQNALGSTYNINIKAIAAYSINNLLIWPVDEPIGDTWYEYADVPYATQSREIPPLGPRNSTVHPNSCAAHDPSNRDTWRLPTRAEMYDILSHVRANGGYDKFGMINVDFTGSNSLANMNNGYWVAESFNEGMAYLSGYNASSNTGYSGSLLKLISSITSNGKTYTPRVRCVRTK